MTWLFLTYALCALGKAEEATATQLTALSSSAPCSQCTGTLLRGSTYPHPLTRWGIISDLPESFGSHGVLYSTRAVLPDNGGAEELRHQRSGSGFKSIDDSFDLFLFHLTKMTTASRIVVYARNTGAQATTLVTNQVIKSEGIIAAVHEFESTLGKRVLGRLWDETSPSASGTFPEIGFRATPVTDDEGTKIVVPPGEGRVIAYGKRFGPGVPEDPKDASENVNCFGYVRTLMEEAPGGAELEISVVAIPAGPRAAMQSEAERLLETGAQTTDEVSMNREPQGCALGRAVGVYPNFVWRNDPLLIDLARLDEMGTSFPMALPEVQTRGCADARQTTDLVLYPGYTRPDTIGNYMVEYELNLGLMNSSDEVVGADIVFGKKDADIGLAYILAIAEEAEAEAAVARSLQVRSAWAGPKQSALEKSLLDGALLLQPGEQKVVRLRCLILGNSSLPFHLSLKKVPPAPDPTS